MTSRRNEARRILCYCYGFDVSEKASALYQCLNDMYHYFLHNSAYFRGSIITRQNHLP